MHTDPAFATVRQHGMADTRRAVAAGADKHHVGVIEGGVEIDDATLDDAGGGAAAGAAPAGAFVALVQVNALHDDLSHPWQGPVYNAALASVLAPNHDDGVTSANVEEPARTASLGHGSENLRSQRDDLHVIALPQLTSHRSEDAGATRVALRPK